MFSKYPMISVDEAQSLIKSQIPCLPHELIGIQSAKSRVLSSELLSPIDFPPFRASIMDGYAVHSAETPGTFPVHQAVRAGEPLTALPSGFCSYITTGAAVPDQAEAVIPIEDVEILKESNEIKIPKCKSGQWIREIGSDIKQGEVLGNASDILTAQHIALLASVGIRQAEVRRRPRIGLVSTGNELREIGSELAFGEIIDSNRGMIKMLLEENHCEFRDYGIVRDSFESTREVMLQMSRECDIIISSGGVSMGDHDFVKPIIEQNGEVVFGRVNMKPGKPMTFGKIGGALVFALPGNPVSCFVCYYLFVRYAVDLCVGSEQLPVISVQLDKVQKLDPRPEFHRAIVRWDGGRFVAVSTGAQNSSRLLSAAKANAVLKFPQCSEEVTQISGEVPAILIGSFTCVSFPQPEAAAVKKEAGRSEEEIVKHVPKSGEPIRCGVITVSDRAFRGEYEDKTGVRYM